MYLLYGKHKISLFLTNQGEQTKNGKNQNHQIGSYVKIPEHFSAAVLLSGEKTYNMIPINTRFLKKGIKC